MIVSKQDKSGLMKLLGGLYQNGFEDEMSGGVISELFHNILQYDKYLSFDLFLEVCYELDYITPNPGSDVMTSDLSRNSWALSKRVKRLFKLKHLLDD